MRMGDPHSAESMLRTINRYGALKEETLKELTDWLDQHHGEYSYEVIDEFVSDLTTGEIVKFKVLKTRRKGSITEKYIDNEHDAQNSLANIRNADFPKGKQGN